MLFSADFEDLYSFEQLRPLPQPTHSDPQIIVLVGPSCSGKTTLIQGLQNELTHNKIVIPLRYTTRPSRLNEILTENIHLPESKFNEAILEDKIAFNWSKHLGTLAPIKYGFPAADPLMLTIYCGNEALCTNRDSLHPRDYLDSALWIGVFAPLEIRAQRMMLRSSDLTHEEVRFRLLDTSSEIRQQAHLLIHNYQELEDVSMKEFQLFVNRIASRR